MPTGILALQGDFALHQYILDVLGESYILVRSTRDVSKVSRLIIPGGESTTMSHLLRTNSMLGMLQDAIAGGMPVLGTCAGCILLARSVLGTPVEGFACMDIEVERNAYGRQLASFETRLDIPVLGDRTLQAWFIRAPLITQTTDEVATLATYMGKPVLVQQGAMLAATFHSEIGKDPRLHKYFLDI